MTSAAPDDDRPDLSLVLTTFRETEVFDGSLPRIAAALRALRRPCELVFVDDGSGDGTAERVRDRLAEVADLAPRRFVHAENLGRGAALRTGFAAARGRCVGYLDLDLEVDVGYVAHAMHALDEGADVALAWRAYARATPDGRPDVRTLLSTGYRRLTRVLLRHPLHDTEAGFKFFRREALARVLPHARSRGWFLDTELALLPWMAGLRVAEVPVPFRRRTDKVSTVRVARDVRRYLAALVAFARRRDAVRRALRSECR